MQNNDLWFQVVVAVNLKGVIGKDNKLPWKSKEDLANFKQLTEGHTIVMGRKTFESLGRRLPNRYHVVVSSNVAYKNRKYYPDLVVTDLEEVFNLRKGPIFLIGGAKVIEEAFKLDLVDRIYLTTVHDETDGDVFLPKIPDTFKLVERREQFDCEPKLCIEVFDRLVTG